MYLVDVDCFGLLFSFSLGVGGNTMLAEPRMHPRFVGLRVSGSCTSGSLGFQSSVCLIVSVLGSRLRLIKL